MKKFNFKDIFTSPIEVGGKKIRVQKIIIPIIQRDYAQGRNTANIKRVRKNFLTALFDAVTNKPITLDFIYGDLDDKGILTPLDGQQRLTTLFLLYWYAAKKEKLDAAKYSFLNYFSYETRPDTRDFCKDLITFQPKFKDALSNEISDQAWFPLSWKKDPSISAMLEMLDAINKKFSAVKNLWQRLESNSISFYFLPITDMGLTDEIYITMNSRGKLLTEFERFKAEFKSRLDKIDAAISNRIILKIDTVWTDMLWEYRDENKLIDAGFLHYFRFLCDILLYKKSDTPYNKTRDEFDLLDEVFSGNIQANIDFIEKSFDCWCNLDIAKFFNDRVSVGDKSKKNINRHEIGKIITYFDNADFFGECLKFYGLTKDGRVRKFTLGATVMLYAFLFYRLNSEKISDKDFRRRIRIINNLVNNSASAEMSNSTSRNNGNRIPAMLMQVENILLDEKILTYDELRGKISNVYNFNETQLKEEREKIQWVKDNPNYAESLFELEDHYLLYGQIGIVGLKNPQNFSRFISLFNCDYDLIDCTLLAMGDYIQKEQNGWRYQMGSSKMAAAWQNLFHQSNNFKNFDNTRDYLEKLLFCKQNFSDSYLKEIVAGYISDCEDDKNFEWSYYYVKYPEFRIGRYGKYYWSDFENAPYLFTALWTELNISVNAYQPFLKAIDDKNKISRESFGQRIEFEKYFIECENNAYVVKKIKNSEIVDRLTINQQNVKNDEGKIQKIDIEDRILKFKNWNMRNIYCK